MEHRRHRRHHPPMRFVARDCVDKERPELLITEAAAFHDRGTDDTNQAGATDTFINDMPCNDSDYDLVSRPRGSLIVEMFNPTSSKRTPAAQPAIRPEFDRHDRPAWTNTIALAAVVFSAGFQLGSQGFGVNPGSGCVPAGWRGGATSRLSRLAPGDCLILPWDIAVSCNTSATTYTLDPPHSARTTNHRSFSAPVYFTPYQLAFRDITVEYD